MHCRDHKPEVDTHFKELAMAKAAENDLIRYTYAFNGVNEKGTAVTQGSGFYITTAGKIFFVTALHLIREPKKPDNVPDKYKFPSYIMVADGLNEINRQGTSYIPANKIDLYDAKTNRERYSYVIMNDSIPIDLAIIKVDSLDGHLNILDENRFFSGPVRINDTIFTAGYVNDTKRANAPPILTKANGLINMLDLKYPEIIFHYSAPIVSGFSGSPLYIKTPYGYKVCGVHSGGKTNSITGRRIGNTGYSLFYFLKNYLTLLQ